MHRHSWAIGPGRGQAENDAAPRNAPLPTASQIKFQGNSPINPIDALTSIFLRLGTRKWLDDPAS